MGVLWVQEYSHSGSSIVVDIVQAHLIGCLPDPGNVNPENKASFQFPLLSPDPETDKNEKTVTGVSG
jgi:hypothetical protein